MPSGMKGNPFLLMASSADQPRLRRSDHQGPEWPWQAFQGAGPAVGWGIRLQECGRTLPENKGDLGNSIIRCDSVPRAGQPGERARSGW